MKRRLSLATICCILSFQFAIGKPGLISCHLKIVNGSNLHIEYESEDKFDIDDHGAEIRSDGIRGLLTSDAGYSCSKVDVPDNVTRGWAAVVKLQNQSCPYDCNIDTKVHWTALAGYRMVLFVRTDECEEIDINHTYWRITTIPIIYAYEELGEQLLKYSVPTSDVDCAAEVIIYAKYINYELLWSIIGICIPTFIITIVCCTLVWQRCRSRGWSLTRWSPRKLPQRKYVQGKETFETCVICQEDFKEEEKIRVLPCDHIFHSTCVDEWLVNWNRICPICQREIPDKRTQSSQQLEDLESSFHTSPEPTTSTTADESIPLLASAHELANEQNRYGAIENDVERAGDQYLSQTSLHTTENSELSC